MSVEVRWYPHNIPIVLYDDQTLKSHADISDVILFAVSDFVFSSGFMSVSRPNYSCFGSLK